MIQAQLVAFRLGTSEVQGSNPGKGENFSMKISDWIIQIWKATVYNLFVLFSLRSGTYYNIPKKNMPLPRFEPGSPQPRSKSDDLDRSAMGPALAP